MKKKYINYKFLPNQHIKYRIKISQLRSNNELSVGTQGKKNTTENFLEYVKPFKQMAQFLTSFPLLF